jgi:hypothetical protein
MIVVSDERLVRLIAIGKKTRHTFPANYRDDGQVCQPKISSGKVHKVYTKAPFGKYGDPNAKPMVAVYIEDVYLDVLMDLADEDAWPEGFADINAFIRYWNALYHPEHGRKKALTYANAPHTPVWVVKFRLDQVLPAGKLLVDRLESRVNRTS